MHESVQGANEYFKLVSTVLQNFGFLINWDKSTAVSNQSIEFLGMLISSEGMSFTLPSEKVHRVHSIGRGLLKLKLPSLRDLSIYLGHLAWAIQAVQYTQAHYRLSQNFLINQLKQHEWDKQVPLSRGVLEEIKWWNDSLSRVNGKTFDIQEPDIIIYSDASLIGWGAYSDGATARDPWA